MDHPQQAKAKAKAKGAAAAPPLYGDVLDAVVSRVPALDLVPASRVSRQWRRAVRSSVSSSSSRLLPWLLLHPLKPRRSPSPSSSYAFDPHSRTWLHGLLLLSPPHNDNSNNYYFPAGLLLPVVAGGGSRLCALSLSAVSVSADPFGAAAWRRFDAPRVWRQDPVVALAGPHLVLLGGACDLALADGDDDPAASASASVEVLLTDGSSDCTSSSSSCWQPCEPIPAAFDGSTSAHWLSAAASERRVYVVERRTGRASWLDPASRAWGPVRLLRPDGSRPGVSSWAAGGTSKRDSLILAGVSGKRKKNFVKVNVWEVEGDSLEIIPGRKDEMPHEMADRLFLNCSTNCDAAAAAAAADDDDDIQEEEDYCGWPCSIGLCAAGDCGYVYNQAEPRKGMVMYQVERDACKAGMIRRWEWVPCPAALQQDRCYYYYAADKVALGCSAVGLDDLAAAHTCLRAR